MDLSRHAGELDVGTPALAAVRVSLLGPVRAWGGDGELQLGSAQQKAVLAALALQAGHSVSKSQLVDAIWGDSPPASAQGGIYSHISALRATLEPHRPPRSGGTVLTSAGSGYCLMLPDGALDVDRFQQLRDEARTCRNNRDTAGELEVLDAALALWRGQALEGAPGPYAARQRARLVSVKLDVAERRARILLNAGRPYALVDELHELTREHPLREGLHGLLMQALYLTGRRQAALGVFQRFRATTIDALGTEPGASLSTLHDRILRDEESLRFTVDGVPGLTRPIPLAAKAFRFPVRRLVGRAREVDALRAAVSSVARGTGGVVWLEGEQGIGKTALLERGLADARGCQLAWSCAEELGQTVTLRVLMDALEVTRLSPDPRRAALAAVVRQLGPADGNELDTPTELAVEGVLDLVRQVCADGPLVLVVDQAHWADPASLHVLRRLAPETERLPLLLVVALRALPRRSEMERTRATLARAPHASMSTVAPLTQDAVEDLVAALAGGAPGQALRALSRQAAGNPLFVKILVEFLCGEGVLVHPGDGSVDLARRNPPPNQCSISDKIVDHLQTAPQPVRELLSWASLCGDRFTRAEITAVLGSDADEAIDDAVTAGFLAEDSGEFFFRHKMVQRAFYGRYASAIRGSLHRQLAETWAQANLRIERIAAQLMLAPVDGSAWLCDWLHTNTAVLSVRAPMLATKLLRRVLSADSLSPAQRDELRSLPAGLRAWPGHDPSCGEVRSLDIRALTGGYWRGEWDAVETLLAAGEVPGRSADLVHATAALLCAHRGERDEAAAHLDAVSCATGEVLAAQAMLAEQDGNLVQACEVLEQAGVCARWSAWLVRLAVELGRDEVASRITDACEGMPGGRAVALHCRALIDHDPASVLIAAEEHLKSGRRWAYAQAMEDAAVLLAAQGSVEKAVKAFEAAVAVFEEVAARWDVRRAVRRVRARDEALHV